MEKARKKYLFKIDMLKFAGNSKGFGLKNRYYYVISVDQSTRLNVFLPNQ